MNLQAIAAATVSLSIGLGGLGFEVDVTPNGSLPGVVIEGSGKFEEGSVHDGVENAAVGGTRPPSTCQWTGQVRTCDGRLGVAMPDDVATAAEIRRAVEEVGLPALAVRIQPGGRTLVNAATIFFVDAPVFQHSTVLLGQAVTITGTPASFTWHHGDGTSQTTSKPGAPYPSMDVTHTYDAVATGLTPRVDVGYRVTYQVNGGASLTIDELITSVGPAASLDVAEARPVIVAL